MMSIQMIVVTRQVNVTLSVLQGRNRYIQSLFPAQVVGRRGKPTDFRVFELIHHCKAYLALL